jgi:hypothetical protein
MSTPAQTTELDAQVSVSRDSVTSQSLPEATASMQEKMAAFAALQAFMSSREQTTQLDGEGSPTSRPPEPNASLGSLSFEASHEEGDFVLNFDDSDEEVEQEKEHDTARKNQEEEDQRQQKQQKEKAVAAELAYKQFYVDTYVTDEDHDNQTYHENYMTKEVKKYLLKTSRYF